MDTSIEAVAGESRDLAPSAAKPVFDAFRAAGVDTDLAYTATRSIQALVIAGAAEMSTRIVERTQAAIDALALEMRAGFSSIEARFEQQDRRFEQQDRRFDEQDRRFDEQDRRFDKQDRRFDRLEGQMTEQSKALSSLREDVRELTGRYHSIDDRLGTLTTVTRLLVALIGTTMGIGAMVMVQLFVLGGADLLISRQPTAIEEPAADAPTAGSPAREVASSGEDDQEATAESPE